MADDTKPIFGQVLSDKFKRRRTDSDEGLRDRTDQILDDDHAEDVEASAGLTLEEEADIAGRANIRRTYYLTKDMIDRLDFLSFQGIPINQIVRAGIKVELARREKRLREQLGDEYDATVQLYKRIKESRPAKKKRVRK